jgi:hypothetical protein
MHTRRVSVSHLVIDILQNCCVSISIGYQSYMQRGHAGAVLIDIRQKASPRAASAMAIGRNPAHSPRHQTRRSAFADANAVFARASHQVNRETHA